MVYQSDKRLSPLFRDQGCLNRCCFYAPEKFLNREFSAEKLNELFDLGISRGYTKKYLSETGTYLTKVLHPSKLMHIGFKAFGVTPHLCVQVGSFIHGKTIFWDWIENTSEPQKSVLKNFNFLIQSIVTDANIHGTHFRVVDYQGRLILDPWMGNENPVPVKSVIRSDLYTIIL